MKTFAPPREFVDHPQFEEARAKSVAALELDAIDHPIRDLVAAAAELPHCFTLQCCHGHVLWSPDQDEDDLRPVPESHDGPVTYRIAYLAVCLENSPRGRGLRCSLADLQTLAPGYVQFGSPDWFWERCRNSYALQVEPVVDMYLDEAVLSAPEARRVQSVRDRFFDELGRLIAAECRDLRDRPLHS